MKRNPYNVVFIEGNLGAGKTLCSVGRAVDYLRNGKAVATNLDLFPEHMPISRNTRKNWRLYRLPDYPTVADLKAIGKGYEGEIQPGKEGLIIFDECASWLNSRDWNSKQRLEIIEFLTHLRKNRWDLLLLIQDVDGVDAQIRKFLMKYKARCYTSDDFPILRFLPRFHFCSVRRSMGSSDVRVATWSYRGTDLYKSYDTEQVFCPSYSEGVYSVLSPWHLVGRYNPVRPFIQTILAALVIFICFVLGHIQRKSCRQVARELKLLNISKDERDIRLADKQIQIS